jgi:type II secretory pathway pseudopilin PulG
VARMGTKIEAAVAGICRVITSTSGFTLLEAIISSAIVAIAGMGVLMMFGTGQTTVEGSGMNRITAQLAQQRIEQVVAGGFGNGGKLPPDPREELGWTPVPGNPGFERTTVFTNVCPTNFAIAWNNGGCVPATTYAEAAVVVVTVRALNNNTEAVDPQTTPAVLQAVLVKR